MVIDKPFDAFEIGERFVSRARTITEADLVMFAAFTGDWYPLHTDVEYVKQTPFKQRIAHGMLVLSVATGLARLEPGWVVAFYGMDRVRFVNPTFIGDTIHVEAEVVEKEDKGARGGVVTFRQEVKKQTGDVVASAVMKVLVAKG
ncbi:MULTISPECIES: MaoC/PaaZ C-terminal domain-containing protein [Kyrpidia]|uniref:Dehydratase n=2 Tax=Kyrpidia spormannii TaxID=2055160 RepID=A0ACA8Z9F8_9BACL|nr:MULTISPECIES: MaoC/PaaZ C-terminal domain-containing protein [Kyrpidia]MCL6574551.1 MaoC family dehydratase N-terminal domain-containing protein [Kyrpidia sp.]CAB3392052.1 Dehydratase [Kyrpidia spormannii]CAB3392972.1 Dehydratase [Kyrpidia spormannii]